MYGSAGAPWRCLCLSSREMDVLQLVAEGLTNGAIAERPVLAPAPSRLTWPTWSPRESHRTQRLDPAG